ncbi:hypothetical protein HJC23_002128 [Cyclotella cryptica]|uniref:Uncharacterized protein n=1 Tax=Cyclotella cryptica TaxID=29204 RepID=A0ABD3Q2W0_9STRA
MCGVNLYLLSLHHKSSSPDEIFLTHLPRNLSHHREAHGATAQVPPRESASATSCYRPRPIAPRRDNDTPAFPVINLGFPKMGTSSLHAFFGCAGYRSMHFRCHKSYACAECLMTQHFQQQPRQQKTNAKREVHLKKCGIADVYSQIDRDDYFPQVTTITLLLQHAHSHILHIPFFNNNIWSLPLSSPFFFKFKISLLEEILNGHPNATYFLTFRSMEKWYHSISHWPPDVPPELLLKNRIIAPGLTHGGTLQDYSAWFCNHVTRVRDMVSRYPFATLVEIDIEDATTAGYMSDLFDVDERCWGRANVNFDLHEELNAESIQNNDTRGMNGDSEVGMDNAKARGSMPWFIHGKRQIRGKDGVMRLRYEEIPLNILAKINSLVQGNSTVVRPGDVEHPNDLRLKQQPVGMPWNSSSNVVTKPPLVSSHRDQTSTPHKKLLSHDEYCNALLAHEEGHWQHTSYDSFAQLAMNNPSIKRLHFPKELDWLKGRVPSNGFGTCSWEKNMLMYNGILGHQCGCEVRGFQPSLSEWVYNTTARPSTLDNLDENSGFHPSWNEYYKTSATLRLARMLANANATLCFAGDSIDYQIYYAMQNNLKRVSQLHAMHYGGNPELVHVMDREIKVTHSTEPGTMEDWYRTGRRPPDGDGSFVTGNRPPPGGFGSMYSILETKAWFENDNLNPKLARIRFFMTYGWSPWNVEFMESCNIVVMNLGLHYSPDGDHIGKQTRHPLMDDVRAAITYLANFTSVQKNRIAVWRSALPQHFDTTDGHFYEWDNLPTNHSCVSLTREGSDFSQQVYNAVYDQVFASMCKEPGNSVLQESCSRFKHVCDVDLMSVEFQTIFKYWLDNNCTERVEREKRRLNNDTTVTGSILRWNIFNLFENIKWHSKDMDCSHFCYIPSLFDNAFERLELLVAPLVAQFKDNTNIGTNYF